MAACEDEDGDFESEFGILVMDELVAEDTEFSANQASLFGFALIRRMIRHSASNSGTVIALLHGT